MNSKDIGRITDRIMGDTGLGLGDKIIVCLDRNRESMLADAWLLTAQGGIQEVFWDASFDGDRAVEAVVRMSEDGDDLVAFHESRPSSRDRRPNGIRVHHEELDFPCVVFYNSGEEPMTVDGEWLALGEYTTVQEVDSNSPEAQKFFEEYLKSPEVVKGVEEARRSYAEKMGRKGQM